MRTDGLLSEQLEKLLDLLHALLKNQQPEDLRLETMLCLFPVLSRGGVTESAEATSKGIEHLVLVLMGQGKSMLQLTAATGLVLCLEAQQRHTARLNLLSEPVGDFDEAVLDNKGFGIDVLATDAYLAMERVGGPAVLGYCADILLAAAEKGGCARMRAFTPENRK